MGIKACGQASKQTNKPQTNQIVMNAMHSTMLKCRVWLLYQCGKSGREGMIEGVGASITFIQSQSVGFGVRSVLLVKQTATFFSSILFPVSGIDYNVSLSVSLWRL